MTEAPARALLNEFTKLEWRDVVMRLRPDWTTEQFDAAWDDFLLEKAKRCLN